MRPAALFKGLSFLLLLNFIIKPAWIFLIDREVQNQLGNEEYGRYFSYFNLSIILLFLADAGLTNLLNRQLASRGSLQVLPFFRIKLLLSLVYVSVLILAGWISGIGQWNLLFYIMGIHLLTSFFTFLRAIITAHQFFIADAWFSVIDKFLVIFLAAGFIYRPAFFGYISLELFLQIQLAGIFIALGLAFYFLVSRDLFQKASESFKPWTLLRSTLPFAIIILLMAVHYRADGFLLERIHSSGALEAGVYALGYRLLDAGNTVGYLAASFLVPFIARNQKDQPLLQNVVINTRHLLLWFGIPVTLFSFVFAPWVQEVLYRNNDPYHSEVIRNCLAALPAYLLVHIYGSLLTATARFRSFILILLGAVTVNIVLNLLLIPAYGALGCTIAALVSHYATAVACVLVASRRTGIHLHKKSLLLYLGGALALLLFFYFGKMVIINVWLILASAVAIMLFVMVSKANSIKKLFISH